MSFWFRLGDDARFSGAIRQGVAIKFARDIFLLVFQF